MSILVFRLTCLFALGVERSRGNVAGSLGMVGAHFFSFKLIKGTLTQHSLLVLPIASHTYSHSQVGTLS